MIALTISVNPMKTVYYLFCALIFLVIIFLTPLNIQGQISFSNQDSNGDGCIGMSDMLSMLSVFGSCNSAFISCGDIMPHEGYEYSTVVIGDHCWFAENLRYLPSVYSAISTSSSTSPQYYVHGYEGNDVIAAKATSNYASYGVLYNFSAIMEPGVCPVGWHIPTDPEWQSLELALGMSVAAVVNYGWRGSDQSTQMRSTSGWDNAGDGTNSSGFNAKPGGYSYSNGYQFIDGHGFWWTSTASDATMSIARRLSYLEPRVYRYNYPMSNGFSARCIQD